MPSDLVREAVAAALDGAAGPGSSILVAASGGVDSTVLLHAVAALASERGWRVAAGHVHHGLRGAAADADADFVQATAAALGIPFAMARIDPDAARRGGPSRARPTRQEAARTGRRAALLELADDLGADLVATGHTLDDQAETVLMRLLRGTTPDGLGGIPERSADGRLIRPLLAVSRAEIEAAARARGLDWREDASNRSADYTRNRLRRDWLPGLAEAFNPRLLRAVGRLAEAHRRDAEWIATIVDTAVERVVLRDEGEPGRLLRAEGFTEMPEALARRVVARLLVDAGAGRDLSRVHVERVVAFLRTGDAGAPHRRLELPGGLRIRRERDGFRLVRRNDAIPAKTDR